MTVKILKKGYIFSLLLIFIFQEGVKPIRECKVGIMKYFGLEPKQYPSSQTMTVCGKMKESCCSAGDELKIWSLWEKYSVSKVNRYISELVAGYERLFSFHKQLIKVSPKKIPLTKNEDKIIPIEIKVCGRSALQLNDDKSAINKIDLLNNSSLLDDPGFSAERLAKNFDFSKNFLKKPLINMENKLRKRRLIQKKSESRKLDEEKMDFERPFEFQEELPQRRIECSTVLKSAKRKVQFLNTYKQKFCLAIRSKLINFKISDFVYYVTDIHSELQRMIELKKSFYCALCNMSKQKYIDPVNKIMTFDQGFCRNLIVEFRDYIKFQNVLLIEYIDMVSQYIRCFQSPADESRFPSVNFLHPYRKQFEQIENCFNGIEKGDFMTNCVFLCNQFSYTTISTFFDGNQDLINRANFELFSFFRKIKSKVPLVLEQKDFDDQVHDINTLDFSNEMYSETNPDKNKINQAQDRTLEKEIKPDGKSNKKIRTLHGLLKDMDLAKRKEMIDKTNNFLNDPVVHTNDIEEAHETIYDSREVLPITKYFNNRFIDNPGALNPLGMENEVDFQIDILLLMKKTCDEEKKQRTEILDEKVIQDYFQVSTQDLIDFENDLFLPITEYSFFKNTNTV